jgi:hypothetical protein
MRNTGTSESHCRAEKLVEYEKTFAIRRRLSVQEVAIQAVFGLGLAKLRRPSQNFWGVLILQRYAIEEGETMETFDDADRNVNMGMQLDGLKTLCTTGV